MTCPSYEKFGLTSPRAGHDELRAVGVGHGAIPLVGLKMDFVHYAKVTGPRDGFPGGGDEMVQ